MCSESGVVYIKERPLKLSRTDKMIILQGYLARLRLNCGQWIRRK